LGFAALARVGPNPLMLAAAASYEYIGVGLGTVAITAFIAQQTSRNFTATQLALLTSLIAVPRTFATSITGFLVEDFSGCARDVCEHDALLRGWFEFFFVCAAVGVPGLLLLIKVAPWSGKATELAPASRSAQISQS
jgi:PAT family beta-lactamase induction signal transducer AmpG